MMGEKGMTILRTLYKGCIELVFLSFLWLPIAYYYLTPLGIVSWVCLLLASYVSFSLISFNKKTTHLKVLLLAIIQTSITVSCLLMQFLFPFNALSIVLIALFTFIFYISGFRQYSLQFSISFPITFMALSLVGHIGLQLLKTIWLIELADINIVLYLLGVGAIILILFITNERMLADQQKLIGHSTAHQHALAMNRILISIFSLIVISFIVFRAWQQKIEDFIKQLINWFLSLFEESPVEEPITQELEQMTSQLPFGVEEEQTPSWLMQMLEKLLIMFAYIVFFAFIIIVMIIMFKLVKKLINNLTAFLTKNAKLNDADELQFIDEVEEIDKSTLMLRQKKTSRTNRKVKWHTLSPLQKCKHLYILFIRRAEQEGHHYINHLTVNEQIAYVMTHFQMKLSDEEVKWLAYIYNEARYGQHDHHLQNVNEQQLQQLYEKFTKKK